MNIRTIKSKIVRYEKGRDISKDSKYCMYIYLNYNMIYKIQDVVYINNILMLSISDNSIKLYNNYNNYFKLNNVFDLLFQIIEIKLNKSKTMFICKYKEVNKI